MNKQLLEFIELCLVDGVISDKEREVIFRKAKELDVPEDECEIILEGLLAKSRSMTENAVMNSIKEETTLPVQIEDCYVDDNQLSQWASDFVTVNEKIAEHCEEKSIKNWLQTEFQSMLLNTDNANPNLDQYLFDEKILDTVIETRAGGWLSSTQTLERINREKISRIIKTEGLLKYSKIGYSGTGTTGSMSLGNLNKYLTNIQVRSNVNDFWCSLIWTTKGVHIITETRIQQIPEFIKYQELKSLQEKIENIFIENKVSSEVLYKLGPVSDYLELWKLYFTTLNLGDLIEEKLSIAFSDRKFTAQCKKIKDNGSALKNALRVNNFLKRTIEEYNQSISTYQDSVYDVPKTIKFIWDSGTHPNPFAFNYLGRVIDDKMAAHQEFLKFITLVVKQRDKLLNAIFQNDEVSAEKITLALEDSGLLNTQFERSLLDNTSELIDQLKSVNQKLLSIRAGIDNMTQTISEGFGNVQNKLSNVEEKLSNMETSISAGNFLQLVSTYQLYKINKNTKVIE